MTEDPPNPFDTEPQPEEPLDPESWLDDFRKDGGRADEDVEAAPGETTAEPPDR